MTTVTPWARGLAAEEPTALGWEPLEITAVFSRGQDWIVTLQPNVTTTATIWPDGTQITVTIYAATTDTTQPLDTWPVEYTWPATVTGNTVYLKAAYADTDTVEANALIRIHVTLPNTPTDDNYTWAAGYVRRDD